MRPVSRVGIGRRAFCIPLLAATLLAAAAPAFAQAFPTRPVMLVVPAPPGAGTDILARTLAAKMSEILGQSVVVENRVGGSGVIGVGHVVRQPADGYTVLLGALGSIVLTPHLHAKPPFDPRADLAPVGLAGRFDFVLVVNPQVLPVTSVKELVAAAKNKPGGLDYATTPGTVHHLTSELFARQAGIPLRAVQYKGAAAAAQDVIAGHVPMMWIDVAGAMPHLKTGRLKPIAVGSERRLALLPDVPTVIESGVPDFTAYAWQGLLVRSGTPAAIIDRLAAAQQQALQDPTVRQKLVTLGVEPIPGTPAEMDKVLQADLAKWPPVMRQAGIKAE
jgi:tripartite-type tricarboxylate transporter receptor subunit TctC